jgi:hypothetical protein
MTPNRQPPTGRITIVFTDLEDSTRMTRALDDAVYQHSMREPHCQRIRAALAAHHGCEVKTIDDSFMIASAAADDARACAAAVQRSLAEPGITATDANGKVWAVHEMGRRGISRAQVTRMIRQPGRMLPTVKCRQICQGFLGRARRLLLRVIVREDARAYHVVAAYRGVVL